MHKDCQELISSYVEEQSALYKPESISSSLIPKTVKAVRPSIASHKSGRKKLSKKTTINNPKPYVVPFSFSVSQSNPPKPDDKSNSIIPASNLFTSSVSSIQALSTKIENTDAATTSVPITTPDVNTIKLYTQGLLVNVYRSNNYESEILGVIKNSDEFNFEKIQGDFAKLHFTEFHRVQRQSTFIPCDALSEGISCFNIHTNISYICIILFYRMVSTF